ncbi:hypothetical protein [Tersicoccus sp. Bi-70]|uniref:hypothetical protein n=1 Tax=Tersicoccus sp. Bi-70 TaxID=1897634 RepID=UPI000976415D|nr:hypothetical protein [Tersicoccus sp. Bi-70]OMH30653.1 hypothetical protein BGP79_11890 [Tersicoccus sp. Bi-70]
MPTPAELQQSADNRSLIRKIKKAMAFVGGDDAVLPETLFETATSLVDLKEANYKSLGIVTADGWTFGRDVSKEDVDALGYASPVRSDTTAVARTVSSTFLEHGRRHMLEIALGTDLSDVEQDPVTGEIVFDEQDLPVDKEYKLVILGVDGPADNQWLVGRGYGAAKVASTDDVSWGKSDPLQNAITWDIFNDELTGTPTRHYLGGTGALKQKDALGFKLAAAGA